MRVVHVSYTCVNQYRDVHEWLKRIDFFTGILHAHGTQCDLHSIHCIDFEGQLTKNHVTYHFLRLAGVQQRIPLRVNKLVLELQPDTVIVHGTHQPVMLLMLRMILGNRPKIFVQHHAEKPARFPRNLAQRIVDRFVQGYFFSSVELGREWVKKGLISSMGKVHEVMELSSGFQSSDGAASVRDNDMGKRTYLWVGRLDSNKDPETLIKAFLRFSARNPGVILNVVYNDDQLLPRVRDLLSHNPGSIHLIGRVPHEEMHVIYRASDFIISTSHYEGSGTAVIEAMSLGCIPILTSIPSMDVISGRGTVGLTFTAGAQEELGAALERSLQLDLQVERKRVEEQFRKNLSFTAIASRIHEVISRP